MVRFSMDDNTTIIGMETPNYAPYYSTEAAIPSNVTSISNPTVF